MTHKLSVVIVDDVRDMRLLLKIRLERDARFEVVGEAGNGADGIDVVADAQPEIVILDLQMPGLDGLATVPVLRQVAPASRIVVLSSFPDPYTLADVLRLGVDAYLDKANAWSELIPTLFAVTSYQEPAHPIV